jgi:uncharacterized protein (TIGR02996 family)
MQWGELGSKPRRGQVAGDQAKLDALIKKHLGEGFAIVEAAHDAVYVPLARWTRRYERGDQTLEITLDGTSVCVRRDDASVEREDHKNADVARDIAERLVNAATKRGLQLASETLPIAGTALETTSNPELAAMCHAAPDDPAPWAVYADWLIAHGDARGELAALTVANEGTERSIALRHALFGGSSQLADRVAITDYRFGFPTEIAVHGQSGEDLARMVAGVLALPLFELLSSLRITMTSGHASDIAGIVDAIADSQHAATLRDLDMLALYSRPDAYPLARLCELTGLVSLRCAKSPGDHAALRTLHLERLSSDMTSQLPDLGLLEYGGMPMSSAILQLFSRTDLPALRHIRAVNTMVTADAIAIMAASPLLRQLSTLELQGQPLSPGAARQLADDAAAFRHLEQLVVPVHRGGRIARALPNMRVAQR